MSTDYNRTHASRYSTSGDAVVLGSAWFLVVVCIQEEAQLAISLTLLRLARDISLAEVVDTYQKMCRSPDQV
jgi:hypothetical protein